MIDEFVQFCEMPKNHGWCYSLSADTVVRVVGSYDVHSDGKPKPPRDAARCNFDQVIVESRTGPALVSDRPRRVIEMLDENKDIKSVKSAGEWRDANVRGDDLAGLHIKRSIAAAITRLHLLTNGLKDVQFSLILNDADAVGLSQSNEFHAYMKGAVGLCRQARGDEPSRNMRYNMPETIYGCSLIITPHKKPGSALVVCRQGPAEVGVEDHGKPNFSAVRLFHHGPREERGMDRCCPIISPLMAVRIEGVRNLFTVGDKVRLKSGGPEMTVLCWGGDNNLQLVCKWRRDDDTADSGKFFPEMLVPVAKPTAESRDGTVFAVGDKVQSKFKIGPSEMTVTAIGYDGRVEYQFRDANGKFQVGRVDPDFLSLIVPERLKQFEGMTIETLDVVGGGTHYQPPPNGKPQCRCPDLINGHHRGCSYHKS